MSESGLQGLGAPESAEAAHRAARAALAEGRAREFAEAVLRDLGDERTWRRQRARHRLAALTGAEPILPHLVAALHDDDNAERRNAARSALAALASPESPTCRAALQHLGESARDPDEDVRILAASALGESGNPSAHTALAALLRSPSPNVAAAAADALGVLGDRRGVAPLAEILREGDFWVRVAAVVALGRIGGAEAVAALSRAVENPLLAPAAVEAMGATGDPGGLGGLRAPAESDDEGLRTAAHRAAAALYGARPEIPVPEWLRASLRPREEELIGALKEREGEADVLLLGLLGTPAAAQVLIRALSRPELRPAVTVALQATPAEVAAQAILENLPGADAGECVALLSALPPLPDAPAVSTVLPHLGSDSPEVRAAAAEALSRTEAPLATEALLRALEDPALRHGAVVALGRLAAPPCGVLAGVLRDPDAALRTAAAEALTHCAPGEVRGDIIEALRAERSPRTLRALVRALAATGGPEAVREISPLLRREDPALRFTGIRALGSTRSEEALPPLVEALADPAPEIQAAALRALGELGIADAAEPVAARLLDRDRDLRRTAAFALRRMAPPAALARLREALQDPDREIRLAAARTLRRIGGEEAREALRRAAEEDPDPLVREAAERSGGDA